MFIIKTDAFCERVVCRSIFLIDCEFYIWIENAGAEVMLLHLYSMLYT